ncbi:MAG TPA: hypothetical protein ENO11_00940, partial [Desulfobacteraceae bacterium]|nr:hypothetical protein [Desulfobacteraceae bacterium]
MLHHEPWIRLLYKTRRQSVTASTLYLDHFQLERAPFSQEPDTRIFFPAAGRRAVLENLLTDIENGRSLVKLIGSEGTGKTLMCRLVEQNLKPDHCRFIYLEHPIGSYENLLRTVCLALGTGDGDDVDEDEAPPDYPALFSEHLRRIETEGQNLVLLVDEAENLFLATLERLIRLICNTGENRNLQILLAGRLELDANLDQLAVYCSNVDINAGYILEPFSPEETRGYIHFRLQEAGIPGDKYLDLFTDDAMDMIFQTAMGNISLTNSLAEQGLKKACQQGMFEVDDQLIQPPPGLEENVSLAFFQGYDFLRENKWWLLVGTLLVWVVLILLWPSEKEPQVQTAGDERLELIVPEQEIVIPPEPDVPGPEKPEPEVPEPDLPGVVEPEPAGNDERIPVKRKKDERLPEESKQGITIQPVEQQEKLPENRAIVLEPDRKKKAVQAEQPVPETKKERKEPPARDADALFNERLKASSGWLAWAYRGGYTVQLMVLASEDAEENLKKILVDDRYYEIKDQLYILR